MALTFGATGLGDRVDCGNGASLRDLDPFTMLCWAYPTTLTDLRVLLQKGRTGPGTSKQLNLSGTGGNLQLYVNRATTDANAITNDTPLATLNKWYLVAGVFDSVSGSPVARIYTGTLTTPAVESTYGTSVNGSGVQVTDNNASDPFVIGNQAGAFSTAFQGRIAVAAYIAGALTLGQIRAWQFRTSVVANTRGFWIPGYNGTTNVPDWSGNKNTGTITTCALAGHVPLAAPFGCDDNWVPYVVAPGGGGGDVTVTPGTIALSLAAPAATPAIQALPGTVANSLGTLSPTPAIQALPSTVALATALPPAVPTLQALPGTVALSLAAPAVTPGNTVFPGVVGLSLSQLAPIPTIQALPGAVALSTSTLAATPGIQASPSAIALVLSVLAPSISAGSSVTVTPSTIALALSALAPTPTLQARPGAVALALLALGATPTIKATPGAVALLLAALAPTVSGPGGVTVTPGTVALVLSALAATPGIKAQPSTVALVLQVLALAVGSQAARAQPTNRGQAVAIPANRGRAVAAPTDRSY